MGGSSGGGTSQSQQQQATAPWQPQQSYQLAGLASDAANYANQQNLGGYQGQFVAGGNPSTTAATNNANGYVNNVGNSLPYVTGQTADTLMSGANNYVQNARSAGAEASNPGLYGTINGYGTGAQTTSGASSNLSNALNNSAVSGAQALEGFQGTLQSAAAKGLSDPTQQIEGDAQSYANSPQVKASLDATNAAINNTLNTQTLPQLNQQEAASGNLNSSRSGAAEGMAKLGAAQAIGSADANIENNALNTGMGTAAGLYSGGLNTATSAGMFGYNDLANNANTQAAQQIGLNEFNTGTQLGAANSGINAGLAGNSQLGNATGLGIGAGTAAGTQAGQNFGLSSQAGLLQQQEQQAADTNAYDQWNQQANLPQQQLAQYWNIAGPNLGSSINSDTSQQYTTYPQQNLAGNIAGGAATAAGLYQQLGGSDMFNGGNSGGPVTGDQNSLLYQPGNGYYDTGSFDLYGGGGGGGY
jgi:hypothetical protein